MNNREFMIEYEKYVYKQFGIEKPDILNCENVLGRNFSFIIFENKKKNYMIMFDADDGSGIANDNFKLEVDVWKEIKEKYDVVDYIIFKMQYSSELPHNFFYPFAHKTHPLGYFPYFPDYIHEWQYRNNHLLFSPNDIDFLWMGTVNYEDEPPVWPYGLDKKHWQLGQRIKGFETINEIKERRTDLNIVVSSDRIPYDDYLNLVMQSKVCLELPGVGNFTTRFFENLQLGRCILGKRLYLELPYDIVPDEHYVAIDDWNELEDAMDSLVGDRKRRFNIMKNARKLYPKLTHEYAFEQMMKRINKHLTKL
jgi:hypothetical protein